MIRNAKKTEFHNFNDGNSAFLPEEKLWMTVILQAYADKYRRSVRNGIASASISEWTPMAQRRAELFLSNSGGHLEFICDLCGWDFSRMNEVVNA